MVRFHKMKIRVLTVQEVSSYLRVHQSTIYRMLKNNQLPAFRVGGAWRFTIAAIDKLRAGVESSAPASGELSQITAQCDDRTSNLVERLEA